MCGRITVLLLTLNVVAFSSLPIRADEPITVYKVPPAARKAAQSAAPGVKFTRVMYDQANKYYKLRGSDARGRVVRVVSDERAEFVQVTVSAPIAPKEVPAAVIETHNKSTQSAGRFRFKATKIIRAEQSTSASGPKTVFYEFIGENEKGEPLRQVIREDGVNIGLADAQD